MALIHRISRLFKADVNAVLDRIEEPELLLKQAIRDMEDELTSAEQRIAQGVRDQEVLTERQRDLKSTINDITKQLDLCFDSNKEELARRQIRKRLEAEQLLKHVDAQYDRNQSTLDSQRATLQEHRATLESLRQKAELFATSACKEVGDTERSQNIAISDDEVEIEFLREQTTRAAS